MKPFQRILVTNDDGTDAPGLTEAKNIAQKLAEVVWVVAPAVDQSGVGQGISMHHPLRVTRYDARHCALSGTPADCVMYAMAEFFPDAPPDLVLSGVNWGGNLSDSVMYSGTVGAVLAAHHLGLAAIALSQAFQDRGDVDFSVARAFAIPTIETLTARRAADGSCCWNVNFPLPEAETVRGLRFTRQISGALRAPRLIAGTDGRGLAYHWLSFMRDTGAVTATRSDVVALRERYISATPLHGTRCDEALAERAAQGGEIRLARASNPASGHDCNQPREIGDSP
jgi:5'-nucleotidase